MAEHTVWTSESCLTDWLPMRIGIALALCAAALATLTAGRAKTSEPIEAFAVYTSTSQAGGHPDLESQFTLASPGDPEAAKNVSVNLPEGVFGDPNAVPRCTSVEFALAECPSFSQVGKITLTANYLGNPNYLLGTAPVFTVEPRSEEESARLSFIVPGLNIPINIPVAVRTGSDYGLRMTVTGITQEIPLRSGAINVWGFPADPVHNDERFAKGSPGNPAGCIGSVGAGCTGPHSSAVPIRPFIDNPTVCTGLPLAVSLDVQTYQDPGHSSHATAQYPPTTGCENETFNPVLEMQLTTGNTDSASGLELEMKAPQFLGFANSPSEIRSAVVTLPEGISINPDAADGQTSCADAQAHFGTELPAACPDSSKMGNFDILTPALDGPLVGALYFGEPRPGAQYRVIMTADGFGIHAKLVAEVHPDPRTGQLVIEVRDLPQVPFDAFNLHVFASDRGLIATPIYCTSYTADSVFTPWNDRLASQHSRPTLSLTSGPQGESCPGMVRPFSPRLVAGMSNPIAGAFSAFHLKLDRDDGDQFLGDLNFRMPPGFTGDLRGITYCSEASILAATQESGRKEQVDPSCQTSSEVGTSNVAAGPGGHPFHALGRMYLAGPFKGAPLSIVAITPALAGPYDYGVVVVRVALHVDPQTAQVTAVSDTMPSIIGGVPIRMRSIQVNIDRERFTINPTNCSAFSVDSQGIGDQGTVTNFSSFFHAVNCDTLPFKPKMTMRQVGGRKATRRSSNPELLIDLKTRPGDANIKSIAVTLPTAFEIDQRHLGNICSEKELSANECAGRTPIGRAMTTTPLLDQPLSGPVFAVSGSGGLPRLAFILNGQVKIVPRADTDTSKGGRLRTTVPVVPDAPIGHFRMSVFGGKTGYLVNTHDLCVHVPVTKVDYVGQNGKTRTESVKVKAPCGKSKKARHKRSGHR
jgi:hypothetical protein